MNEQERMGDPILPHYSEPPLADRLSPAGQARERSMRGELLERIDRRRRVRHAWQGAAGAAALVALLVTATLSIPHATTPAPVPRVALGDHSPEVLEKPDAAHSILYSHIAIVENDPTIVARLSTPTGPPALVRALTDDQLLGAFHEEGFSVALVRFNGRLELLAN